MTIPTTYPAPIPTAPRHRPVLYAILGALVALLLAGGGITAYALTRHAAPAAPDRSGAAVDACKGFVGTQLRAPSTARWVSIQTTDAGKGFWYIHGQVDAMNGLGGYNNVTFACHIHERDGNWYDDGTTVDEPAS